MNYNVSASILSHSLIISRKYKITRRLGYFITLSVSRRHKQTSQTHMHLPSEVMCVLLYIIATTLKILKKGAGAKVKMQSFSNTVCEGKQPTFNNKHGEKKTKRFRMKRTNSHRLQLFSKIVKILT